MISLFSKHHEPHAPNSPLLELEEVSLRYETGAALESTSLNVAAGEKIAVVGPNGAGKSTLFKIICGLMEPTSGRVRVYGSEPRGHICIGYVPQRSQVDWQFPATVADAVMMGRTRRLGVGRWPGKEDRRRVDAALDTVGLKHLANRRIQQLSGGQQQRVFIARALAQEAEMLLLDEPMAGLDTPSQRRILDIMHQLGSEITVLVSLHDLNITREWFEKVVLLNHKVVSVGPPAEVLTPENLAEAFHSHLHFSSRGDVRLAVSDMCCKINGNGDD